MSSYSQTSFDADTGLPLNKLAPESLEWVNSLGLNCTLLSEVLNIPADIHQLDASNVQVSANEKLLKSIEEGIRRANKNAISNAQKVQKFRLLPHDFSIPTSEYGPTLKIRRNIVLQKYENVINEMYNQKLFWHMFVFVDIYQLVKSI